MSSIRVRSEATAKALDEILNPKPQPFSYVRIVNGNFFRHTIQVDGKHTVEVLSR